MTASTIATSSGLVTGFRHRGIHHFHGVPYAAPPVGDRRFARPEPHPGWTGELDATRFGPEAPQMSPTVPMPKGYAPTEDCLQLNIVSPGVEGAARPVMVWIHGGAFVTGSARLNNAGIGRLRGSKRPVSPGARRFARNSQAVVVSLGYRLGALGWLQLEHLSDDFTGSGNAGLADQILGLKWIRENIHKFGGDPAKITVVGQSAGAMAIATMLAVPSALEGVRAAGMMSGAAEAIRSQERAVDITERVMGFLKVDDPHKLRTVTAADMVRAQGAVWWKLRALDGANLREDTHLFFGPTVDSSLVTERPLNVIARGDSPDIPLLIGHNLDEFRLPLGMSGTRPELDRAEFIRRLGTHPSLAERAESVAEHYIELEGDAANAWDAFRSDWLYRLPAERLAATRNDHYHEPAYRYSFVYRGRGNGAAHAAQLRHAFHNTATQPPVVRRLSEDFHRSLISFVQQGDPGHANLPAWFPYRDRRATMVFGAARTLVEAPEIALHRLFHTTKDDGGGAHAPDRRKQVREV